jgi:hypothetical protein
LTLFAHKSGSTGLVITIIGAVMLAATFLIAFDVYRVYMGLAQSDFGSASADFVGSLNSLLQAAMVVMFLGIMGWVGSTFLLRGVEFMKVDRGVGVVTFKVDKATGMISSVDMSGRSLNKTQQILEIPADN